MVLAVATSIVAISAIAAVALRGELKPLLLGLDRPPLLWAIAGGIALTIAVNAPLHALSLGPANVVVPIYGMFIVGGSLLGVLFLGEPMAWHKIAGLIAAVIRVILIALWVPRRQQPVVQGSMSTDCEEGHGQNRLQNRQA